MEYSHEGFVVTTEISGANDAGWDLKPGQLVVSASNGTFTKLAPGICLLGFKLSEEQIASLRPVKYWANGLDFMLEPEK